jgi:ferritin-like metal-binding protein YciE
MARQKAKASIARPAVEKLLYQMLETEMGGVQVYTTALDCVQHPELREEFEGYLTETKRHVRTMRTLLESFGLDPEADVPARRPVRLTGTSLVKVMKDALANLEPADAQLVAAECVVHAETKDHLNWELLGEIAQHLSGDDAKVVAQACEDVEKEEDHHLYHTTGWTRELWFDALGIPAVLPPPEEEKQVETAIGAARAKNAREQLL